MGHEVNCLDRWSKTPLFYAMVAKKKKTVKLLANLKGEVGIKPIELACLINSTLMRLDLQMFEIMKVANLDFNCHDYDLRTPLHVAGELGLREVYFFMLKSNALETSRDRWGSTPNLKKIEKLVSINSSNSK